MALRLLLLVLAPHLKYLNLKLHKWRFQFNCTLLVELSSIYIHTSKKRDRISEAALMDPFFSLSTNDGPTVEVQHDHRKNLLVTHTLQLICASDIYFLCFFFLIWFVTFALAIWLLRMRDIFAILGTWTFSIMLMAKGSQWKSHNFKVFKLYSISQVDICHTSWPIPVHIFCIDNLQFLDFWCLMCYCPIRIIYIWSVLQSTAHVTRLPRTWSSMLSLNWKKLQSRKNEMVDR